MKKFTHKGADKRLCTLFLALALVFVIAAPALCFEPLYAEPDPVGASAESTAQATQPRRTAAF